MKKIFTTLFVAALAVGAYAQSIVAVSPLQDEMQNPLALFAEGMSPDHHYVAGMNDNAITPTIWNTLDNSFVEALGMDTIWDILYTYEQDTLWNDIYDENWNVIGREIAWQYIYNDLGEVIDSTCMGDNYEKILSRDTVGFMLEDAQGSFHAVSDAGLAVGELGAAGNGKPVMMRFTDAEPTYLFVNNGEYGSAYGITADESVIVGFCYDADWHTAPYIWTNNGQTRTALPIPTEAELGFAFDYASARYISADGRVIMGYVADANFGAWVMILWKKNAAGEYVVDASAAHANFAASFEFDPTFPYTQFEGKALSANGEWVALFLEDNLDPMGEVWPVAKMGRMNTTTGAIESVACEETVMKAEIFGIANDGTSVGRMEEGMMWNAVVTAFLWGAGVDTLALADDFLPEEPMIHHEMQEMGLCAISADANYLLGTVQYIETSMNEQGEVIGEPDLFRRSFIIEMAPATAVESVKAEMKAQKLLENGQVVILRNGRRFSLLGTQL